MLATMARYLAIPLVALAIGAAAGFALLSYGSFLTPVSLIDAILTAAVIAMLLIVAGGYAVFARYWQLASRMQQGLGGFEADIARRLANLETALDEISLVHQGREHGLAASLSENVAELRALADEESEEAGFQEKGRQGQGDNVIRFDPGGRNREPADTAGVSPGHGMAEEELPIGTRKLRLPQGKLADALEKGLVEAWFQPVVTLPGRKTRMLEAVAHVSNLQQVSNGQGSARSVSADQPTSVQLQGYGSHAGEIDHLMLTSAVRLARKLDREDRGCTILWRMAVNTIRDPAAFDACMVTLKNSSPGPRLIKPLIEWRNFRNLDAAGLDHMHGLAEAGYRLAVSNCPSPQRMREVLDSGLFDMVMVDAELLTSESEAWREALTMPIAGRTGRGRNAASMAEHEIIATNVDTEIQVMALIDNDILLAQGDLFSAPKRLRDDRPSAAKA